MNGTDATLENFFGPCRAQLLAGMRGWRWLFVVEGVPSVLLGICFFVFVDESPSGCELCEEC